MNKIKSIQPMSFPWKTQDPFLFCAHHRDEYPAGNAQMGVDAADLEGRNIGSDFTIKEGWRMYHGQRVPGFPYHPHRGFETITINKEGVVDHSDSLGAAGRFMGGDVQWMTAGSGIQHSEMFPLIHRDRPNPLEIFQIWLNLPKAKKMVPPHFKMLWKESIPKLSLKDEAGNSTHIDVIAGSLNGINAVASPPDSWAADPQHAIGVFTVQMTPNAHWTLPATNSKANRNIYFYSGDTLVIEGQSIKKYHKIELEADQNISFQNGSKQGFLLILEGVPIGEPVAQYGPFVMNSQEEIQQTIREFRQTQFGGWPWPEQEQVHNPDKTRFALHADGRKEVL